MSGIERTLAIARKVWSTLRHDKRSLALMLVAPILAMGVFGFAFGSEVEHVPVIVVNEDEGDLAARVLANLDPDLLDVTHATNWSAAQQAVQTGDARAAIHFPANFTAGTRPGPGFPPTPPPGSTLDVHVDGSNSQMAAAVGRGLSEAMQRAITEGGVNLPVTLQTTHAYAEGAEFIDFFVPGIMIFASLLFTTLLTLLAFVSERTTGTLSRLLMTPVREWEIVGGYALAFGIVGVIQGAILLAVAVLLFDALVVGSILLAFLVIALMAVDALSLGILLSAAAEREGQAVQMIPLVIFPAFLLSGIFVPVESLPTWLRPLAWAIPPTHAVQALRDIMLRGWGIPEVWPYLAALVGFAALFLGLASWGLSRRRA